MESNILLVPVAAIFGASLGAVLACIPGLHVYNVLTILLVSIARAGGHDAQVPFSFLSPFFIGIMVSYAVLSSIPSILLSAPDESSLFTVLPGQNLLFKGRGYEAVLITVLGSALGLLFLTIMAGTLAPFVLPSISRVLAGHAHWMLWCVIIFIVMSEGREGGSSGDAGWGRLGEGRRSVSVGLVTFMLSGLLGFILFYRSPGMGRTSLQNLMPAFVGLFTLPQLLVNLAVRSDLPEQNMRLPLSVDMATTARGGFAGLLGGSFAAFFPAVTGGVGGLLARHATAVRDDRMILIAQGTSKLVYYGGTLMLLSVPGLGLTSVDCGGMLRGFPLPKTYSDHNIMLASIALAGAVALMLAAPLTRAMLRGVDRVGHRRVSALALVVILLIVLLLMGLQGLFVTCVAAGIGLLPVLFGARRMNCLGVVLLPVACTMSGSAPTVAGWLGLL